MVGTGYKLHDEHIRTKLSVIYIDQPIGTGFSYGVDTANSTYTAAPPVWSIFQILFESQAFSKYQSRELVLIYMHCNQSC